MDELQNSTAPEMAKPTPFTPYKSESSRDVYRARVLFQTNKKLYLKWAVGYILTFLLPAWLPALAERYLTGKWSILFLFLQYILVPPLLICLYNRLIHLIRGGNPEEQYFFELFRRGSGHSMGHNLAILLAVAFALYGGYAVFGKAVEWVVYQLYILVQAAYSRLAGSSAELAKSQLALYPFYQIPVFLATSWLAGYLCIHASLTCGERALGLISGRGMIKKILLAEAHLMAKYFWAPFLLYYLTYPYLDGQVSSAFYELIYVFVMPYALLGFGLWYFPQSAIVRSLILMQQPRLPDVVWEPEGKPLATSGEAVEESAIKSTDKNAQPVQDPDQALQDAGEGGMQE